MIATSGKTSTDYGRLHDPDVDLRRVLDGRVQLQITTARLDIVPVHLRVLDDAPDVEAGAVHVVEVDLEIPSGELAMYTSSDTDFSTIPTIAVTSGRQRVRVTYRPRGHPLTGSHPDEEGEHLDYLVDLWFSAEANDPVTLTQGPQLWAG